MEGIMNKIFNFFLSFVLTAFFATSTFAATKVVWWMESDATTDPVVQEFFVDAFNAEHDDIELEVVFKEDINDTIRPALLSGSGPDIFDTPGASYIKIYQDAGLVKSLQEYADQYGWQDKLLEWAYNSGVFNGELYSIPKNYETMIYFYNKTLFEENGWSLPNNLEEVEALAAKIKAKGMNPYAYGSTGWQPTHEHLVGNYFNTYAGPDNVYKALIGEKKWTDPEFVESIELLRKHMVDDGYWSGGLETYYSLGWDDFNGEFVNRESAMLMIGTWGFNVTATNFAEVSDDWDWAALPILHPQAGDRPNYQLATGGTMSVNAASKNPEAAAKVIDWILSDRARVLSVTGQLGYGAWLMPLHYEDSDFDPNIDPRQKRFLTEFAEATGSGNYGYTTWTFYPNDPGVHIWKDMEVVWAGDITPLEFMEEQQRLWDKAREDDALVPVGKR